MSTQQDPRRVITGKTRWAYLNVWEPRPTDREGETPYYSACILIPKTDKKTINAINQAVQAALEEGKNRIFNGKIPSAYRHPLRDGDVDRPEKEEFRECYFINAKTKHKPDILDTSLNPILEKDKVYSGCYGVASLSFYAYDSKGSKGVTAQLRNLMKVEDGKPLSGGLSAQEEFATVVTEYATPEKAEDWF